MKEQRQKSLQLEINNKQLSALLNVQENWKCFECEKVSVEFVETRHAIFLCSSCAKVYGKIQRIVILKNLEKNKWGSDEIDMLASGGNSRFRSFLRKNKLLQYQPKYDLKTKQAEFYRLYLLNPSKLSLDNAPPRKQQDEEEEFERNSKTLSRVKSDDMFEKMKVKISKAEQSTKEYGTKALENLHNKFKSGQLKQDAKKAADKVSETAKAIWNLFQTKLSKK